MAFQLPEPSMILGSPMHKKAEFRLLNQVLDSGGGENGENGESGFVKNFKSGFKASQKTMEKIKASKKSK